MAQQFRPDQLSGVTGLQTGDILIAEIYPDSGNRQVVKITQGDLFSDFAKQANIDTLESLTENIVYTTGDQLVSGIKAFDLRPTVNGSGVLLQGEATKLTNVVFQTGDQIVSGKKDFDERPTVSGSGLLLKGEILNPQLQPDETDFVTVVGNQTVFNKKTFQSMVGINEYTFWYDTGTQGLFLKPDNFSQLDAGEITLTGFVSLTGDEFVGDTKAFIDRPLVYTGGPVNDTGSYAPLAFVGEAELDFDTNRVIDDNEDTFISVHPTNDNIYFVNSGFTGVIIDEQGQAHFYNQIVAHSGISGALGETIIQENLTVSGSGYINGDLTVSGLISGDIISDDITVGDIRVTGDIRIDGDILATGVEAFEGLKVVKDLTVSGTGIFTDDIYVGDNAYIGDHLKVSGSGSFESGVAIGANYTDEALLVANGNVRITAGDLFASGAGTFLATEDALLEEDGADFLLFENPMDGAIGEGVSGLLREKPAIIIDSQFDYIDPTLVFQKNGELGTRFKYSSGKFQIISPDNFGPDAIWTFDNSGFLGINNTNPSKALDVYGDGFIKGILELNNDQNLTSEDNFEMIFENGGLIFPEGGFGGETELLRLATNYTGSKPLLSFWIDGERKSLIRADHENLRIEALDGKIDSQSNVELYSNFAVTGIGTARFIAVRNALAQEAGIDGLLFEDDSVIFIDDGGPDDFQTAIFDTESPSGQPFVTFAQGGEERTHIKQTNSGLFIIPTGSVGHTRTLGVNESGRVSIGVEEAEAKLHVRGSTRVEGQGEFYDLFSILTEDGKTIEYEDSGVLVGEDLDKNKLDMLKVHHGYSGGSPYIGFYKDEERVAHFGYDSETNILDFWSDKGINFTTSGNSYRPTFNQSGIALLNDFTGVDSDFGFVTGATNIGSGEGIFADKDGGTINLYSLTGGTDLEVQRSGDQIYLSYTGLGAGQTGGQANTASNLGYGSGLYANKLGVELQFKTLHAGQDIAITGNNENLFIDYVGNTGLFVTTGQTGDFVGHAETGVLTGTFVEHSETGYLLDQFVEHIDTGFFEGRFVSHDETGIYSGTFVEYTETGILTGTFVEHSETGALNNTFVSHDETGYLTGLENQVDVIYQGITFEQDILTGIGTFGGDQLAGESYSSHFRSHIYASGKSFFLEKALFSGDLEIEKDLITNSLYLSGDQITGINNSHILDYRTGVIVTESGIRTYVETGFVSTGQTGQFHDEFVSHNETGFLVDTGTLISTSGYLQSGIDTTGNYFKNKFNFLYTGDNEFSGKFTFNSGINVATGEYQLSGNKLLIDNLTGIRAVTTGETGHFVDAGTTGYLQKTIDEADLVYNALDFEQVVIDGIETFSGDLIGQTYYITRVKNDIIVTGEGIFAGDITTSGNLFAEQDSVLNDLYATGNIDNSGLYLLSGKKINLDLLTGDLPVLQGETGDFVPRSETGDFIKNSETGEFLTTAVNSGLAGENILYGKQDDFLIFKKLYAGNDIDITDLGDTLEFAYDGPAVENAANVGVGGGIFKEKDVPTKELRFKSLIGSSGFKIIETADELLLNFTGTGAIPVGEVTTGIKLGQGVDILSGKQEVSGLGTYYFNSLFAGDDIDITDNNDGNIVISVDGNFVKYGENLGGGAAVYKSKATDTFRYRSFVGQSGISVAQKTDTIEIAYTGQSVISSRDEVASGSSYIDISFANLPSTPTITNSLESDIGVGFYMIRNSGISTSGYRAVFSSPINESGFYLHTSIIV